MAFFISAELLGRMNVKEAMDKMSIASFVLFSQTKPWFLVSEGRT